MHTITRGAVIALLLGLSTVPGSQLVFAAPPEVKIISVSISADYKSMTIVVSRAEPSLFIDQKILINGQSQGGGGGGVTVSDTGVIVMHGPRDSFETLGGEGTYTLVLRACPQDQTTSSNYAKYCGEPYEVTVDYRDPQVLEQVAQVGFSADFDTANVSLSKALPSATVRYDLYVDGKIRQSDQVAANNNTVLVINGFRERFIEEGADGEYTVGFRLCENRENMQNQDEQCSTAKFVTVNFREDGGFSDVPASHSNADAIEYLRENGIISGYPDGTFRPNKPISRVEFVKIVTLSKWGEKVGECGGRVWFKDFENDAWYLNYVCMASSYHLIEGYPDGTFHPHSSINFVEAAKIITRADERWREEKYPGTDVWYERYVRYLSDMYAIPMSIQSFGQFITRGEMAEIMYRLDGNVQSKPSRTYGDLAQ